MNRLTFAALAFACIMAAGAGGYFATRQNTVPTPAAAAPATAIEAPAAAQPVQETEAVVTEAPKTAAATPAPVPTAPSVKSSEAKSAAPAAKTTARATPPVTPAPALDRSWPSSASSSQQPQTASSAPASPDNGSASKADDHPAVQAETTPRPAEPPQKTFDELVVAANSVIGLQTETRLSSETARVEDRVEARVTRDVKVGSAVAIPAGSRAIGSVTQVERGGKFKERARLAIRFNTLLLPDGTRLSMSTETIYREGEAPGNSAAQKVGGGAAAGAILGAILGGAKGAAIGATVGAGGGAAVVENGDRSAATLPAGTPLTVRLLSPVSVTVEHN